MYKSLSLCDFLAELASPLKPICERPLIHSVGDLHSKILDAPPQSYFLHFRAVCGGLWPNNRLAHPLWSWGPPLGNPVSTADIYYLLTIWKVRDFSRMYEISDDFTIKNRSKGHLK